MFKGIEMKKKKTPIKVVRIHHSCSTICTRYMWCKPTWLLLMIWFEFFPSSITLCVAFISSNLNIQWFEWALMPRWISIRHKNVPIYTLLDQILVANCKMCWNFPINTNIIINYPQLWCPRNMWMHQTTHRVSEKKKQ